MKEFVRFPTNFIEMREPMFWLDLCLSSLLLWGGVSGFLAGWKKSVRQLAALIATFSAASILKGDMKQFITLHYPLEETIKALIIRRISIPVDTISQFRHTALELPGLPAVLQRAIAEKIAYAPATGAYGLAELLATVMVNASAFIAAAVLWCSIFHLAGAFWPEASNKKMKFCEHWGGLWVGAVRQLCLIIFIVGAAAPFLWLPGFPREIFDPQQAVLVRWSLLLFSDTGVWWN
jgi:hypothetical protein